MTNNDDERTPQEWREILRSGLQTPEEARTGNRRERRQARANHKQQARKDTRDWISDQRRRDPIRPAGAIIIVCLILALGAGARWLWPGFNGAPHHAATVTASATPASQDSAPPATASATPSASTSSTTEDRSNPDAVIKEAIQLYLTRDPLKDRDHVASVDRAAPFLEPALVSNLEEHADPGFDKLTSQSANATVTAVTVGPRDPGLPQDNPLRVWRHVTATLDVKGYTETTQQEVMQVEVTNNGAGEWRVSRILGL